MELSPKQYVLGLDIGIASVGAALLADDHIEALFVRTFDKAETAKEGESLNKIRRDARLVRRRLRRRVQRLLKLRRLFKRVGLLKQQNEIFDRLVLVSPWQLRSDGLDRKLTALEWANVLYHLVKHRGFQSNRKSELKNDEDKKTGEMLGGIAENQALLAHYRTVGEMVWKDERFALAKRNKGGSYNHTLSRADLAAELRLLFTLQRQLGNPHATNDFEQGVMTLLMERKPMQNILHLVGKCTFEPGEHRTPKACYSAEKFVWLTKLNNLKISAIGTTRPLTQEERQLLIHLPFSQSKLTYKQVRKILGLGEAERFVGLDCRGDKNPEGKTALFEAKAFHKLRDKYEKSGLLTQWQRDSRDFGRLNDLGYALTVFKEDSETKAWLAERGFEPEVIEAVLEISFTHVIRLSLKALDKILPWMEQGLRYDEAVQEAGYKHHSQIQAESRASAIPAISRDDIANPVVYRSLNQARKLVNAIVEKYGPPHSVNIELARDLNKPLSERQRIKKEQDKYRDTKEKDYAQFIETFGVQPRGDELLKWRLYREQNGQCAYSQKPLEITRLFEPGYAEIDHALPYSRSFDDGLNNKVLVHAKENRDKGNRTPYEYLRGADDTQEWQQFVAWVIANKSYRVAKRQRLLRKDFGEKEANEFRERNLTDTRYACKKFKELVQTHLQLADGSESKCCVVVSGQLTAYLRARWGLNKVRANGDLHHALDAAVVAGCTRAMVKRLADYSRCKELTMVRGKFVDPETGEVLDPAGLAKAEKHFPQPFEGFRAELEARLSPNPGASLPSLADVPPIRVSRASTRRGLGAAHQETIRSARHLNKAISSVKVPLTALRLKDLPKIAGSGDPRNQALIAAIEDRLRQHGDNGEKAFKEPLRRPATPGKEDVAPIVRTVRLVETQKSGLILPRRGGGVANNGDMLRVDIFTKGGKFYAVPLYVADAVRKVLPNRAVVALKPESEWPVMDESYSFMFSLHPNDWLKVSFKSEPVKEGYFAGLDRSTGAIAIWAHDRNQAVGKDGLMRGIGIKTALMLEKCHVDLLGRLHRVRGEVRQPLRRG